MPDIPSKPPPPPRGHAVYDDAAGPPQIQTDRRSWDEDGNYRQPGTSGWTFSEQCHAVTAACVLVILGLLCVSVAVVEGRYQKALREVEAARERLEAENEAWLREQAERDAEDKVIAAQLEALQTAIDQDDEETIRLLYKELYGEDLPKLETEAEVRDWLRVLEKRGDL